ncbi:MAG: helix-turn-helix domain-containing protein [Dorea sp.]|nr:helix-turn-helix domain-containing protein [Dorea sp.]
MVFSLTHDVAQKLVETVKDVCGYDINYIDPKGMIIASTDKKRIGTFHEIGRKAAENGTTLEVTDDDDYLGTKKGVNIPFFYKKDLVAVIGISGDPDEVRSYALLIQRIAALMLREREVEAQVHGQKNEISYIMHSLVENHPIDPNYLKDFLSAKKLSVAANYRMVVMNLNTSKKNINLSRIEEQAYRMFEQLPNSLYLFNFPHEFWLLVPAKNYERNLFHLKKLAELYPDILTIGVGNSEPLFGIHHSYKAAKIALKTASPEKMLVQYDDLTLEILLGNLDDDAIRRYKKRTIVPLPTEDLEFLKTYFQSNLSLQKTAETLFIHKNTVQYKLNRIYNQTGLNPREFQDAVVLYLAARLDDE